MKDLVMKASMSEMVSLGEEGDESKNFLGQRL